MEVRGERCEVRMEGVGEGWEWNTSTLPCVPREDCDDGLYRDDHTL